MEEDKVAEDKRKQKTKGLQRRDYEASLHDIKDATTFPSTASIPLRQDNAPLG